MAGELALRKEEAAQRIPRETYLEKLRASVAENLEATVHRLAGNISTDLEVRTNTLQEQQRIGGRLTDQLESRATLHLQRLSARHLTQWLKSIPQEDLPGLIAQMEIAFLHIFEPYQKLTEKTQQISYDGGNVNTIDWQAYDRGDVVNTSIGFSSQEIGRLWLGDRTQAHILRLILNAATPLRLTRGFEGNSNLTQLEGEARYLRAGEEGKGWQNEVTGKLDRLTTEHPGMQFPILKKHLGTLSGLVKKK